MTNTGYVIHTSTSSPHTEYVSDLTLLEDACCSLRSQVIATEGTAWRTAWPAGSRHSYE